MITQIILPVLHTVFSVYWLQQHAWFWSQCLIPPKMWQRLYTWKRQHASCGCYNMPCNIVPPNSITHLHWAAFLIGTSLDGRLKAVSGSLAWGPVCWSQMIHEVLQTHHTVVLLQRLQLEIITVRNMHLLQGNRQYTDYSAKQPPHWQDL